MFTACGAEEPAVEGAKIAPLPAIIDMNAPDNCTLAVSFEEGDTYMDDNGRMQMDVTVYAYDVYDMVDIANLKEGDTIVIRDEEVLVESMETLKSGLLFINGGMENDEILYYPGSFLTDQYGVVYDFTPYNTSIVVEDGQVIHVTHICTP